MSDLQVFTNPEFGTVRTLLIDAEPWAVGKDVATALGYSNTKDALAKHVDPEDKQILQRSQITTFTVPPRGMTFINESGIYSLILLSKLPSAKRFKRWVTSEVLPALRKTGKYAVPTVTSEESRLLTSDDYLTAARILAACRNERLPYVLPLIKKAGIDIEIATLARISGTTSKDPETALLLTVALKQYGVSIRELERLTGIHTAQLYRMRDGTSRYNAERAAAIRDVIHALVPDLDLDAYTDANDTE